MGVDPHVELSSSPIAQKLTTILWWRCGRRALPVATCRYKDRLHIALKYQDSSRARSKYTGGDVGRFWNTCQRRYNLGYRQAHETLKYNHKQHTYSLTAELHPDIAPIIRTLNGQEPEIRVRGSTVSKPYFSTYSPSFLALASAVRSP